MDHRQDYVAEEQEEDMFFNAGRAANYAEQYAPSQRLKDTLLGKSNDSKNPTPHHDDINLQKQLNKQQQQQQQPMQPPVPYQPPIATTPIRTMNNSNTNIISNNNSSSNNTATSMMMNSNANIPRNIPSSTMNIPSMEVRLPTLPSIPSSVQSNSAPPTPNEKAIPTLSSPGVVGVMTSDQKRKISLQYLAEISNFSRKDVQDAMVSKIDNESGEIYGNIPDIIVGMKYSSRMDLLDAKIHTDLQSDISTNGNYIKPVPALIMYDTQDRHEDRGTVVLYSIPFSGVHTNNEVAPSIKGTPCEALAQNSIYKIPVRVIRGSYESSIDDGKRFRNGHCPTQGYRYDGIYFVGEYFYEPGATSFVFKLIRIYGQPELPHAPNLSEPPARSNASNQRPSFPNSNSNQQQGPPQNGPPNMPNMPNDRKIFGIPSFVTQRILSGSQDYLAQSTKNSHNMPFIPSLPQHYSHPNNYNSQNNNPQNPHSLPAMPSMPNMNYNNRNNYPNNNGMNNNYNEQPPQNNRPVMRNNQSNSQQFNSPPFSNTNNNNNANNSNNDGTGLSHTSVRQMINNLKFQNSNFGGRIQSYSYNISELNSKVEDVQKSMPALGRQLTSRNKTFTWKLGQEKEQEEFDRTKYFVYDDEDVSEEEEEEIERPSRSKKKKTHHVGSSSSVGNSSSVRITPNNDSTSSHSSSKSNNKQQ